MRYRLLILTGTLLASACATPAVETREAPAIEGATGIVAGFAPEIRLNGVAPGETIDMFGIRMFQNWEPTVDGSWAPVPRPVISFARLQVASGGSIDLGKADVVDGTWTGADPYGLLWSGRRADRPGTVLPPSSFEVSNLRNEEGRVLAVRNGAIIADAPITFSAPPAVVIEDVSSGRVTGAFAFPEGAESRPVVILLHGSEGGGRDAARDMAQRYAGHGFAAFALNYFAWDFQNLTDVPNVHVNQPIEVIADVRDWLTTRPEADVSRLGIYGHSKGAEYAEVAAVRYPWIKAVTACVPTDIVWEGYGIGDERALRGAATRVRPEKMSSWSWNGQPLEYVPLKVMDTSVFKTNTERYDASRRDHPEAAAAAIIPLQASRAKFLLIGGGRDEVWASGEMATQLAARFEGAGRSDDVELRIYPKAGHQICGDGLSTPFAWADPPTDDWQKDPAAEGQATSEAWQATVAFFKSEL